MNDDLPDLWKGMDMPMMLIEEKQQSLRDLVAGQNNSEYLISLAMVPLLAFAGWRAKMPLPRTGYWIMAATMLAGAIILWLEGRRYFARFELTVAEFHRDLLSQYDRRIRFLKSVKFWYALPLFGGAFMAMYPISARVSSPWGIGVVAGLLILAWVGVWHMNDVRRAGELRKRRDEVQRLLGKLERS
jgi:hypothetical protein